MIRRFGGPGMHGVGGIPLSSLGGNGQDAAIAVATLADTASMDKNNKANTHDGINTGTDGNDRWHALVRFSFTGTVCNSAVLWMYCDYTYNPAKALIYRIMPGNDWVTPTWNERKPGTAWLGGATGCGTADTDYVSATEVVVFPEPVLNAWSSIDVTTIVQSWLAGTENQGFYLTHNTTGGRHAFFQNKAEANPPYMVIT